MRGDERKKDLRASRAGVQLARRSELVALDVENSAIRADGSTTVSSEGLKTGDRATNYRVTLLLIDDFDCRPAVRQPRSNYRS